MKKRWLPVLLAALLVGLVLTGNAASLPFADVSKGAWYYDAVQYVYENDLFSGTSDTTFEPQTPMTRGMLVSVLWRLDGKPEVPAENPFTDIAPRVWYTSGVLWAASEDIVSGMGGGIFAPNENITREQMASIMMRYAAYKGIAVEARADLSGYADSGKISKWAKQSVSWANAVGILSGQEAGAQLVMEPQGEATRAQVASILMRFKQNVIDAVAHVHTVETDAAVAPSCTQTGLTEGTHCSVCHQILTPQQLIAALGHDLQQHAAKEPTCTESGWQAYEDCSRCDYTTYVELGALGHDLQQHAAKDPTCTESGWQAYEDCSRCDYTTYVELGALGHAYGEWQSYSSTEERRTCTRCDAYESRPIAAPLSPYVRIVSNANKYMQNASVAPNGVQKLSAKLGRNEGEGMQFLLQFDRAVSGVWFEISPLVSADNVLNEVECYRQHYILHSANYEGLWHGATATSLGIFPNGYYPMGLVPIDYAEKTWENIYEDNRKSDIAAGNLQGYWITVWSAMDQAPGVYTGTVTVHYDGGEDFEIPVEVEVWDITLPRERAVRSAFRYTNGTKTVPTRDTSGNITGTKASSRPNSTVGTYYSDTFGLRINSDDILDLNRAYYDFGQKYRITVFDPPTTEEIYGALTSDEAIAKWVSDITEYVKRPETTCFQVRWIGDGNGGPSEWDIKLAEALKEAGIDDKAVYYALDEQTGYNPTDAKEILARKELMPRAITMSTTSLEGEYLKAINCYCPKWGAYDAPGKLWGQQVKSEAWIRDKLANGYDVWWYSALDPNPPAASYMLVDWLMSARIVHWMQRDYGVQGEWYFQMSMWYYDGIDANGSWEGMWKDPWSDPYTYYRNGRGLYAGDGQIVLPGYVRTKTRNNSETGEKYKLLFSADGYVNKNIPVPTVTLEAIRDGFEDIEYLVMAEEKIQNAMQALGITEYTLDTLMDTYYKQIYKEGVNRDLTSLYDHNNPELMEDMRCILAEDILRQDCNTIVAVETTSDTVRTIRVFTDTQTTVCMDGQTISAQAYENGYLYEIPVQKGAEKILTKEITVGEHVFHRILNFDNLDQYGWPTA